MSGQDERVFRSRVSRRGVLGGALGILAAGAAAPLIRPAAAGADPVAPTSRAAFDAMDLALNDGNGLKNETNDSDSSGLIRLVPHVRPGLFRRPRALAQPLPGRAPRRP